MRTALALFAGGVTFVRFFGALWIEVIGWVFIPIGAALLIAGLIRYRSERSRLGTFDENPPRA